jgi:sarcosine oxidase subunit alpha
MHVLRAEKGYIIIGQDTDGTQTPYDLNMSWIVSKKKEFIGKRSFQLPYLKATGRAQLVGLLPENDDEVIPEGAYITILNAHPDEHGLNRMGEVVSVPIGKKALRATICDAVFIDKENIRRDY